MKSFIDSFTGNSVYEKGKNLPRWTQFYQENDTANNWVEGDGNIYGHQILQYQLVKKYGKYDIGHSFLGKENCRNISKRDYVELQLLSIIHDLGEYEHGDICKFSNKEQTHNSNDEYNFGVKNIKKICCLMVDNIFNNLDKSKIERLNKRIDRLIRTYKIDSDYEHYLNGLFRIYEKFSYVNGAIITFSQKDTDRRINETERLIHNIIAKQVPDLIKAFEEGLPSAGVFLIDNLETITQMYKYIIELGFIDEVDTQYNYNSDFASSVKKWKEFTLKNNFHFNVCETDIN